MEVIFIKDLKNQGKKGQVKNVKDGYAQNFLIKNGYAVIKNKENLAKLNHEIKKKQQENEEHKKIALSLKTKLDKEIIEFKVKTGVGDKVFGSISVKQIKEELEKKGYKIEKSMIEHTTIATLGFHNVDINLYNDIIATIKVHVIK
ncbi:MAG: 50S ribosomal protein L9 [Bacilli bacterium]|nr:50S ribosomal protein L9 [Bacilli bacterium]